jgi:hypothetical protein
MADSDGSRHRPVTVRLSGRRPQQAANQGSGRLRWIEGRAGIGSRGSDSGGFVARDGAERIASQWVLGLLVIGDDLGAAPPLILTVAHRGISF